LSAQAREQMWDVVSVCVWDCSLNLTDRLERLAVVLLHRHAIQQMPRKLFGSFSTDYGYRRTYAWRHADEGRLLSTWGKG
jgi:hypothetical protein